MKDGERRAISHCNPISYVGGRCHSSKVAVARFCRFCRMTKLVVNLSLQKRCVDSKPQSALLQSQTLATDIGQKHTKRFFKKRTLFNWTKQDKICQFSRKSYFSKLRTTHTHTHTHTHKPKWRHKTKCKKHRTLHRFLCFVKIAVLKQSDTDTYNYQIAF